ncbi:methyltransferase family protein [Marinimicrobium locisalis]|uniref:methyltransferase family protein n=1 Tax=Marinimicrobium locisalis TaxID=546022 RepID=UPI003221912A
MRYRTFRIRPIKPVATDCPMPDIDLLSRHFLGFYFLLIALYYASTSVGLWRRTGVSHIQYGPRGSATWWHRHIFNAFRAVILVVCLTRMVWPELDTWLGIIAPLYQPPVLIAGIVALLTSYSIMSYVHAYMHQDWRSGIDPDKRQTLLTQGPFARSRNPLFLGIMLGQLGLFLALPSIFTLICFVAGVFVIVRQALREEKALETLFGSEYLNYQKEVPRWW